MVSPIASSAGAVGPSTLKNMMDASLEMERLGKSEPKSNQTKSDNHSINTDTSSSRNAGPSNASGSSESQKKESTILQVNTSTSQASERSTNEAQPSTFKSIWSQPVGKVLIYFGIIWLLNYGST
jgi:uncharacterized membrane protein